MKNQAQPPAQAANPLAEAVRRAVTENRDCRGSAPCGLCERRIAGLLAVVDAYITAQVPPPSLDPGLPPEALDLAWNALQYIALHAGDDKTAAKAREALRAVNEYLEDGTTEDGINKTPRPAPGLAAAMASLIKVAESHERVMYAATIDIIRGDPESALRMLDEQLDGWDGRPWNTAETGTEWLERTREGA